MRCALPDVAHNLAKGWHVSTSVGGGPARGFEVDTGSRGVVLPATDIGPGAVGPGPGGHIEYSSDGKVFSGHFYLAPVRLSAGGTSVRTVPIEVLGVERASCDPKYPKCKPGRVAGVGMLGVGFDRTGTIPGFPPELLNPFLALEAMSAGTMQPGYVITPDSVTLGITRADTAGYATAPLRPGGSAPCDWDTAAGCVSFPRTAGGRTRCGTVLVDTGIGSAIIGLARALRPAALRPAIPAGTEIVVREPDAGRGVAAYDFTTGAGTPASPTSIRWARSIGTSAFVNTGRRLIARYGYLFDDARGAVGLRAR